VRFVNLMWFAAMAVLAILAIAWAVDFAHDVLVARSIASHMFDFGG